MKSNIALVLSRGLEKNKSLDSESKSRTDFALSLFKEGKIDYFIMSGGHKELGERYGISIAEVMKRYGVANGIPKEIIFTEELSLDSVGQLIFSKILIDKNKWNKIFIISQDYHIKRLREISNVIFGKNYEISFLSVKNGFSESMEKYITKHEEESICSFKKTFENVTPGSDKETLNVLLNKHPLYSKNKEIFEKGIKNLRLF